jgi:predicted tellurium resistance membrane protein TerC
LDRPINIDLLEIVLGIDNIILFQLQRAVTSRKSKKATKIGMFLAMFMRIALLFGINLLIQMKEPWFTIDLRWLSKGITGQSIIYFWVVCSLFTRAPAKSEKKVDIKGHEEKELGKAATKSFQSVFLQIIMIDLVFSFDSILTAVGMTNVFQEPYIIMITAVVISVLIMMQFCSVGSFVNKTLRYKF